MATNLRTKVYRNSNLIARFLMADDAIQCAAAFAKKYPRFDFEVADRTGLIGQWSHGKPTLEFADNIDTIVKER